MAKAIHVTTFRPARLHNPDDSALRRGTFDRGYGSSVDRRKWQFEARDSYDRVAHDYAELTRSAPQAQPWMASIFTLLATLVVRSGGGTVLDVGCGPGWWTGLLAKQGVDAFGVDISSEMVRVARDNNPDARFEISSLLDLPADDATVAAAVCWFVLHHLPDEDVDAALTEMIRVVKPGGVLLIGGHVGDSRRLKTEGYGGHPMNVLVNRRRPGEWETRLRRLGLRLEAHTIYEIDDSSPWHALYARKALA